MKRRRRSEGVRELNLTPIMNLVLILIPLLLLSVVFLEVSVIAIEMPPEKPGGCPIDAPERLILVVSEDGFWVIAGDQALPPQPGCEGEEVTLCALDKAAKEPTARYDWVALYNLLVDLKATPDFKDQDHLEIVPAGSLPYGVLVKTMDVARAQRANSSDAPSAERFLNAEDLLNSQVIRKEALDHFTGEEVMRPLALFPRVSLGLPALN